MTASPADSFPDYYPEEFYSDGTTAPTHYDDNVLPIEEFPGYVDDRFDPTGAAYAPDAFSDPALSGEPAGAYPTEESRPFKGFPAPSTSVPEGPSAPLTTPQAPNAEAVPTPPVEAAADEPLVLEDEPLPPTPDWYWDLSLTDKTDLTMLLKDMDKLHFDPDNARAQEEIEYELRSFMKEHGLVRSDFAALLESKGWEGPTDLEILDSLPRRRFRMPGRSKTQRSEGDAVLSEDNDEDNNLSVEIDPDSGKITSPWDFAKVVNQAEKNKWAYKLGLDETVHIGKFEIRRGRLIGYVAGALAVSAAVVGVITLLRHGDTSGIEAATGSAGGGGINPTTHAHGGSGHTTSALPTTTEAAPTSSSAPDTSSSVPDTTTAAPGTTDPTATTPPVDTSATQPPDSPAPGPSAPDTVPVVPDTTPVPSHHVTVEAGDTVYGLGHEQGLTDTQIANGINDGSIHAYDAQGHEVNVNNIRPGDTVDFNVDTTPPSAPVDVPVTPPTEVQPDIPAGSEPVHLKQGGTLSESVQDWLEQHGRTDNLGNATEAVMNYNQTLGIDLNGATAHNLHSTNIGGQAVATLEGKPLQMPPEAMFDQLMDALKDEA